jgi:group I intron endonuclease
MIGIYKITNPKGEVYIGKSKHIHKRFLSYVSSNTSSPKIYNSILNYGIENHTFEILCECGIEETNKYEAFFINKYNSVKNGLNLYSLNKSLDTNMKVKELNIFLKYKYKSIGKIELIELRNQFIKKLENETYN